MESHTVGDQNDIWGLGLCRLVWEELGDKTKTKDLHIT